MAVVGPVIARMRAKAPRETAWQYIAHPELRAEWWPDVELDVVFGGAVTERWTAENGEAASRNAVGTVDVLIEGHALGFRWRDGDDPHETAVLITFRSQGDETDIMVTETGFGVFPDAFERTADAQQSWIDLLTDYVASIPSVTSEAVAIGDAAGVSAVQTIADGDGDAAPVEHVPDEDMPVEDVPADAAEADLVDAVTEAADVADAGGTDEVEEAAEATEVAGAEGLAEVDGVDEADVSLDGDDVADAEDASEAEAADESEPDAVSEIEALFEADDTEDAEDIEDAETDPADEEAEEEALDFDSLIRGDLGDKS
ncbi:activator of Hsp90 ATPase-like protein [Mycolicibacterium mucogenicum 261Sha1.1M5]|nr:activator of Hsp90 ATPase-like protein [Mycolicibacterium mucogenicum 261Sha1.1M5]